MTTELSFPQPSCPAAVKTLQAPDAPMDVESTKTTLVGRFENKNIKEM